LAPPYYSQRAVFASLSAFFIQSCFEITLQVSRRQGLIVSKMEGKTNF